VKQELEILQRYKSNEVGIPLEPRSYLTEVKDWAEPQVTILDPFHFDVSEFTTSTVESPRSPDSPYSNPLEASRTVLEDVAILDITRNWSSASKA
jgi:hypothetical protein